MNLVRFIIIWLKILVHDVANNEAGADDGETNADNGVDNSNSSDKNNASNPAENTSGSEAETAPQEENKNETNLVNGMRPKFKEAMDSYEAFYDEYCTFMKKYNDVAVFVWLRIDD